MDYRELLRKYIQHVAQCEGVDFISEFMSDSRASDIEFTKEEVEELLQIRTERY